MFRQSIEFTSRCDDFRTYSITPAFRVPPKLYRAPPKRLRDGEDGGAKTGAMHITALQAISKIFKQALRD